MKPRFVLLSSVFALACGDSTPDPGADGGRSECTSFAECGGPNNVKPVVFCEHCFSTPNTHVCEAGVCRPLASDVAFDGQLRIGFTVPSAAVGARGIVIAALLPIDGVGASVTCDRLIPGGPSVFEDFKLNTTRAVAVALTPAGDPTLLYQTLFSADPGSNRLIYLGVTSEVQGKGTLMAEGCLEGIEVRAGETHNLSVTLSGR